VQPDDKDVKSVHIKHVIVNETLLTKKQQN